MKIIHSISEMQNWASSLRRRGHSVGFVPTMGALHIGHASLVRRARRENDEVVVSIFINPLQFGPQEDLKRYPRTLSRDVALLKANQTDVVFVPKAASLVPEEMSTYVRVPAFEGMLEGVWRPGHFQGVATIVLKLFQIVQPTRAYFGDKDYQQLCVIRRMVEDLNQPVHVIACPTVREKDGLACSSRNRYLSKGEREEAVKLYQTLYLGRELVSRGAMGSRKALVARLRPILSRIPKCRIDYLDVVDPESLQSMKTIRRPALLAAAIRIGKTRLIDNILIP